MTRFPTTPFRKSVGEPVYFCVGGAGTGGGDPSDGGRGLASMIMRASPSVWLDPNKTDFAGLGTALRLISIQSPTRPSRQNNIMLSGKSNKSLRRYFKKVRYRPMFNVPVQVSSHCCMGAYYHKDLFINSDSVP